VNETTWDYWKCIIHLTWSFDINDANSVDCPTNGTWTASNERTGLAITQLRIPRISPLLLSTIETELVNRVSGKSKGWNGDRKSQDNFVEVGAYQVTLTTPE
jgi:hypothetical protein